MEIKINNTTNDRNFDGFIENSSSQESQHSRKSVVTASLNASGREKKLKKFNCKKMSKGKSSSGQFISCANTSSAECGNGRLL